MGFFDSKSTTNQVSKQFVTDSSGSAVDLEEGAASVNVSGIERLGGHHNVLDASVSHVGLSGDDVLGIVGEVTSAVDAASSSAASLSRGMLSTIEDQTERIAELAGSSSAGVRGVVSALTPLVVLAAIGSVLWVAVRRFF